MLGIDVEYLLKEGGFDYIATGREIDISKYYELKDFVASRNINWVINCASYTAVDRAEEDKESAFIVNGLGVFNIARIAGEKDAGLIHISTDYVFNGTKEGAYTEDDPPNPIGIYGESKLEGEKHVARNLTKYYIIRTSWLFGLYGSNFVKTMLKLFKTKSEIGVVSDQWGSPTYTVDLADVLITLVNNKFKQYGIYHFTNEGITNWYEFARAIYHKGREYNIVSKEINIKSLTTDQYPTKAKRPKNSYLSKEKIKRCLNRRIPPWQDALERFMNKLKLGRVDL